MSRRDGAIVAWHEVPGAALPRKSRPVGYGVIRAGVRTNSMIGATVHYVEQQHRTGDGLIAKISWAATGCLYRILIRLIWPFFG